MKYLIVSGGEVKEGFLTWIVKNGGFDVILAADAGMEALYRDHILPDIIVGDFNSERCNGDCGHWCNRYQN